MRTDAIRIADEADSRIISFRGVRDADLRGRDALFCVESPRVVRRFLYALLAHKRGASTAPTVALHSLLLTPAVADSLEDLLGQLQPNIPIYIAEDSLMTNLAGYKMHKGALALGYRPHESTIESMLAVVGKSGNLLVTSGVVLTDNIGAIFRAAGSFGGVGVLLAGGSSDPLHRKVIRVSSGRVFTVPWAESNHLRSDLARLRSDYGFTLIAAEDAADAVPIDDIFQLPAIKNSPRIAVIFGSEGSGVSADIRALCDATSVIPMAKPNALMESSDRPSLNVSVASALFLHRLSCARSHPSATHS
ncbi:MAG: RNA methyltransferase [Planctomycetota bacterium]|nr:RNA methyltransferase [Planctomycetota bacterium]